MQILESNIILSFHGNHLSSKIHRWARAAAKGLTPKNGMKRK